MISALYVPLRRSYIFQPTLSRYLHVIQNEAHKNPELGKPAGDYPLKVDFKKDKIYPWCACGHSKKQPLCDGSHTKNETTLEPVRVKAACDDAVWFCVCKQTKNRPYCDGSHENL